MMATADNPEINVVLGIDPDMKKTSIAAVDYESGDLLAVSVCTSSIQSESEYAAVLKATSDLSGFIYHFNKQMGQVNNLGIVVEAQEVAYTAKSGGNPRSIMFLANVAGVLLAEARQESQTVLFPNAQKWKGSVPKMVHHRRIYSKLGWEGQERSGYLAPTRDDLLIAGAAGANELSVSDWKHVNDAIGLAMYGRDELRARERRQQR